MAGPRLASERSGEREKADEDRKGAAHKALLREWAAEHGEPYSPSIAPGPRPPPGGDRSALSPVDSRQMRRRRGKQPTPEAPVHATKGRGAKLDTLRGTRWLRSRSEEHTSELQSPVH